MEIVKQKVEFTDAQEKYRKHPETFDAPTEKELDKVEVGGIVKVCLDHERFWTIVKEVEGNRIKAEVNNDLLFTDKHGLRCGDIISFEKRHIYSIWRR